MHLHYNEMCQRMPIFWRLCATSSEILKLIDVLFREYWPKCVSLCTDGERALSGLKNRLNAVR